MDLVLTDGTLRLCPITRDSGAAFAEAVEASAAEISRWFGESFLPRSRRSVTAFIAAWEQAWADGSGYGFVATDANGRCVGFGLINHVNHAHRLANLGYWVRSDAVGRGWATAMTRMLAEFGFRHLGLTRLELVIEPDNVASQRVAEKAGAVREGRLRNRLVVDGRPRDAFMYGLVPPGAAVRKSAR